VVPVSSSETDPRAALGRLAEALAAKHLVDQGFVILGRNVRFGRLELDIVARRARLVVFCEVRARMHDRFVAPAATIDRRKIDRLRRAAAQWLKLHRPGNVDVRLDAAAVVFDRPGGRLEYYEGAY
jgi:putative endonuclease